MFLCATPFAIMFFFNGLAPPKPLHAFMEMDEVDDPPTPPTCINSSSSSFCSRQERLLPCDQVEDIFNNGCVVKTEYHDFLQWNYSQQMIVHVRLIKGVIELFMDSFFKNSQESQASPNSMHGLLFGIISSSNLEYYICQRCIH